MSLKKKRSTKDKDRVDRKEQNKFQFNPLALKVKYPETAILLLQCKEQPILLAAAAALSKYGSKSQGHLEILFDLEIVTTIIPLIEHEDLFTRRFAAKLLAEMVAISNVRNFLLEFNYYIAHFTKVLVNDNDLFMQEFSSAILAKVSKDMFGVAQLLKQCPDMNFMFKRLQSPDPDVMKNNLEILYNLLQDPTGAEKIIETKDFNFNILYNLFNSPYREIQELTLKVIGDLVNRNQDNYLQQLFRESNGVQALLKFLDSEECSDLHTEALRILCLASDNPTTVELLDNIGGIRWILNYVEDKQHSKLFIEALDVVLRLSHTALGRKTLYTYGIVERLLCTLADNVQPNIYEISCRGIGMMTLYNEAAKELTANNCVKNILDLLKNESLKWSVRQAALFALNQLLKCDIKNCHDFLDNHGQNYLVWRMKQTVGKVPVEFLIGAVKCLTTIAMYQLLRTVIVNVELIDVICAPFELTCVTMNEYKIACCNALSILCTDKIGRSAFLKAHGPTKLYNLLGDVKSIPVRNAAVQLVQLLCADPVLSNAFVEARYLNFMWNNRSTARAIPSWDMCIEALFDSHLPFKFAFTGRLSLHDVTENGFYIVRGITRQFPILDDILRFKFSPLEFVYVVNCVQPQESSSQEILLRELSLGDLTTISIADIIHSEISVSANIVNQLFDWKFGRLRCDTCLYNYIELFKCKLVAAESKYLTLKPSLVDVGYVASRARMLAKFVARQMSGPDPLIKCVDHQLEIHLKELRETLETSVIPLGMLRVGSYLERAFLFKVIADRIHLPAALVRGEYGKVWNEIAVPQMKVPVEESSFETYLNRGMTCPEFVTLTSVLPDLGKEDPSEDAVSVDHRQNVFPTRLMKPNFIVDLMDSPGDLIPIDSQRAKLYYEKQ